MKATPSVDGVIALRQSLLTFSPSEGARMRLSVRDPPPVFANFRHHGLSGHSVHDRTPALEINRQRDMFVRNQPPAI